MTADPKRPLYCSCRGDGAGPIQDCRVHGYFQTDITTANRLITEWTNIASGIAMQCKWRTRGQCLITCPGLALCNLDGLVLVDAQGQPAAQASSPANLKPMAPEGQS